MDDENSRIRPENNTNLEYITQNNSKLNSNRDNNDGKNSNNSSPEFKCIYLNCNKIFQRKIQLKNHLKLHMGEKAFKCPHCQKSFSEKGNLKVHLRIHNNEKPYCCKFENCGKRFRTYGHLKDHLSKHLNIKPYTCNFCSKRFSRKTTILKHYDTHKKSINENNRSEIEKSIRNINKNLDSVTKKGIKIRNTILKTGDLFSDKSAEIWGVDGIKYESKGEKNITKFNMTPGPKQKSVIFKSRRITERASNSSDSVIEKGVKILPRPRQKGGSSKNFNGLTLDKICSFSVIDNNFYQPKNYHEINQFLPYNFYQNYARNYYCFLSGLLNLYNSESILDDYVHLMNTADYKEMLLQNLHSNLNLFFLVNNNLYNNINNNNLFNPNNLRSIINFIRNFYRNNIRINNNNFNNSNNNNNKNFINNNMHN